MNGVINVYKEKGYTSHDVVAKLRGILHQKKIGHTGTLDPDATGVLPVCVGNATKLCDFLADEDKEYEVVMLLGKTSDTYDATGTVLTEADEETMASITADAVKSAILSFIPGYNQVPPMYSAKKVDGKKLYELAREGKEIDREPVEVKIPEIDIVDITLPRATFRVTCSKGTYIRSLCFDIGEKLGCGALMESLVRTRVSVFEIEDAMKISEIEDIIKETEEENLVYFSGESALELALNGIMIPTDMMLEAYPAIFTVYAALPLLENGNIFSKDMVDITFSDPFDENSDEPVVDGTIVRVYNSRDIFVGLYKYGAREKIFKPYKIFPA